MAPRKPSTKSIVSQTNAVLAAAAQLAVTALVSAETTLGVGDASLTATDKRRSSKLRKGGEKYAVQIGSLAQKYQLETAAMQVATMLTLLGKAAALQPVVDQLTIFTKHVGDVVFAAQSQAWDMALQYYALLARRARTNGDLATSLQPIGDFLAYRHTSTKPPTGSPSKRQVNAAKKAQQQLETVAGGALANTNLVQHRASPVLPTLAPAAAATAPSPAPSPTPAPAGNGAPPAGASSPTNGGAPPATHS